MSLRIGILASSILKFIIDNFNRTTVGSLGTATSGNVWQALRGVWFANGTSAQSDAIPSSYALASIGFGSNATMKADTTGGVGLAFWASGGSDWWGAYPFYSSVTSTSSICNAGYNTFSTPNPCCSTYTTNPAYSVCNQNYLTDLSTTNSCCGGHTTNPGYTLCNQDYQSGLSSTSPCCDPSAAVPSTTRVCSTGYLCTADNFCYSIPGCAGSIVGSSTLVTTYSCYTTNTVVPDTYNCYTATTTYPETYSCFSAYTTTSVTTYTTSIRIISSVSGAVVTDSTTSLTSNTTAYTNLASMEVNTNSNTITAKGYTSPGQVSQFGSTITRTPASPNRGTSVGIIKAPTDANQGSTLDNYSATI